MRLSDMVDCAIVGGVSHRQLLLDCCMPLIYTITTSSDDASLSRISPSSVSQLFIQLLYQTTSLSIGDATATDAKKGKKKPASTTKDDGNDEEEDHEAKDDHPSDNAVTDDIKRSRIGIFTYIISIAYPYHD